ncbi:hypothetical protein [Rhodococcus sp. (in: high G+C Gram-positive bacteria)]|uniref:hypothetical protein n=1 Tax=Rhodococcus sp. TaxID=1831 RepID=UPI003B8A7E37
MDETTDRVAREIAGVARDVQVNCKHRSRVYRDGVLIASDIPLSEVAVHRADPDTVIWVDLSAPTLTDLVALAPLVGGEVELHPLALENAASGVSGPGWCAIAITACCMPARSMSIRRPARWGRRGSPRSSSPVR